MDRPTHTPRTLFGIGAAVLRAAILAAWGAASVYLVGIDTLALPAGARGLFPALQALAAIILVLAALFTFLARHRFDLGWPAFMIAGAATLQVAAAWVRPMTPGAGPIGLGRPGPDLAALGAAGATALCFGLILLHASWVLTPNESRAPFRARLRAWLRTFRFNPVAVFFGPVFQKEVRVAGRKRLTYISRALYPLLLLGIAALSYGVLTSEISQFSGAERLQRLQELAPQLALVIAWCQFGVLSFIAPVMTAPAVCDERRQLSLPALMTTPMTSSQIIFGKLTSRLVMVVILALVSTPLLLAVRIYGGLETEIIVATTCISLSAAVLGASLGLLYSVWHRRASTAAVFGLLTMFLLMAAVIVAVIISSVRTAGPPPAWVIGLSAPTAMAGVTIAMFEPPPPAPGGMRFLTETWITNTVVNLTLSAFACTAATLALRSVLRAEAAGDLAAATDRPRRRRSAAAPKPDGASADADLSADAGEHVRTGAVRLVGDRPVLWREVRQASFGSRNRLIIVAACVALAAAFIYWRVPLSEGMLHGMIGMIGLFIVILQACVATTASIAGEFESRTWQVLLTTPLTGREIVLGKLLGGLRRQWFILACLAGHFLLGFTAGYVQPIAILHLAIIYAAPAVMLSGTGLLLSLLLRRSAAAGVANIVLALGLWLVLPIGVMVTLDGVGLARGDAGEHVFDALMAINPFAMAGVALEPVVDGHFSSSATPYSLPSGRLSTPTFTAILAGTASLAVAIGLLSALAATRLFRNVGGRTS